MELWEPLNPQILTIEASVAIPLRLAGQTLPHLKGEDLDLARSCNLSFNASGYPKSQCLPMKVMLWNIRGAGSGSFLRTIRD
jgi:hypothetical protein